MKILILKSNPRKSGFTEYCAELFVSGIRDTGIEPEIIDLTAINLGSCRGCFNCWTGTPGKCIQKDDGHQLLHKFLDCNRLVMTSPLYAYSLSSSLKVFMERTLPLLAPGIKLSSTGKDHNNLRYPQRGPEKMSALIVGGLKDPGHYRGAVESLRLYAEGFGIEFCGAMIRPESFFMQFNDTKPKTIKIIETALIKAGRSFASDGMISEEIMNDICLPLAPDLKTFADYSNIYWEYASHGGDLEEIRKKTRDDIRIMMNEMVLSVDPVATKDVRCAIQFNFPDKEMMTYLQINRGNCIAGVEHPSPDLSISCSSEVWTQIVHREEDPIKAVMAGEIVLKGDKSLFRKIGRYFPPASH